MSKLTQNICVLVCMVVGGCGKVAKQSGDPLPVDQTVEIKAESPTHSTPTNATPSETMRGSGLRESIIGKWIERGLSPENPETMEFSKNGKFKRWAVSTSYEGTYKIIDEKTIEIESASVLSGMQYVKNRMDVNVTNDILQIAGRTTMGFRRDKTSDLNYFAPKIKNDDGKRELARLLVGTWEEASFGNNLERILFSATGELTFSGPPRNIARYRVLDANTIEVDRTASAFSQSERWTVKVDRRSLEIKGQRRSYIRIGSPIEPEPESNKLPSEQVPSTSSEP